METVELKLTLAKLERTVSSQTAAITRLQFIAFVSREEITTDRFVAREEAIRVI